MRDIYTQVAKLRQRNRVPLRLPFPDLSTPPSPCTCGFGPTPAKPKHGPVQGLIIGCLHKSSYQVLSKADLPFMGRKV